mmetsp:Transcript_99263/g.155213  ORF Transcript_99263/g.155213 Transcript_99263/m.155213 type:complete len:326 (+) Transcript_99263:41-1018(+)
MPAAEGKGKSKGAQHGKNKSWRPDSANKAENAGSGKELESGQIKEKLDLEAKELKAKLMSSTMCKKPDEVVDLDAEDAEKQRQSDLDQKIVERQARFGRDSDGAHAKSSVAIKRTASTGSVTGMPPSTPSPEASASATSARTPYAPPPPVAVAPVSAASVVAAKSSDGARTKAGSASMQAPAKPRGTVGTSATTSVPAAPSPFAQVDAAVPSTPTHSGKPLEPLSQMQLSQEHSAEKAAFDALTVPVQSACLKRALESQPSEAARKRPRYVVGEPGEWEAEYRLLLDWLETNLPNERHHSKVGAALVTCTSERLSELERAWQQLV